MYKQATLVLATVAFPLAGLALSDVIDGTNGVDNIVGTEADDVIIGADGDDTLSGGAGNDVVDCGPGDDFGVDADGGDDRFFGGSGNDLLRPLQGSDVVFGGTGDDTLDLVVTVDFFTSPPCSADPIEVEYDVARGGQGNDVIQWASGSFLGIDLPITACAASSDAEADGGRGWDQLYLGLGSFLAPSDEYVLESASSADYEWQVRSLVTGATIQLRNIEEIVFIDQTLML